ncbi:unnamed protein product [Schistosoma margrebowiei]|uniref:Uncharacterized protein n=1 Tax=Schistosoma margrebowiei TaxID=48269 RepID=A0A183MNC3_9TREM|nr:unnamed protein product [Schistosoma margrebowiei]
MWRKMKIIPVPKKVSGDNNVKFRPIAIISPFLKTMEKLLILRLQPAIKEHIDPYQFVYRCKRNTLDAVAVLHHSIVFNLEKGKKYVRCAFLDYNSAFDSIPRQRLLNKLISVNTDSWITNCLCSYLSGREQYTVFGGKFSESLLSHENVPQGAVLSLPFFSFFLNDQPSSTKNTFVKYADDLTVCMPISSSLCPIEMSEFLSHIDYSSIGNGLILNPSKYQAVNFSMRHNNNIFLHVQILVGVCINTAVMLSVCGFARLLTIMVCTNGCRQTSNQTYKVPMKEPTDRRNSLFL